MGIAKDITTLRNERLLNLLSLYLNDAPRAVTQEDISALVEFGVSEEQAFAMTLAGLFDLDIADNQADRDFYDSYFPQMIHRQDAQAYYSNPYFENIQFPAEQIGNVRFVRLGLAPYEGFVVNDFETMDDGRIIPQIGFFDTTYTYPALLEGDRPWMTLLPNEINSQQDGISAATGHVLTFGLGLGYFAYMCALKPDVSRVTVVDGNQNIIDLFSKYILSQFGEPKKIEIVCSDAFEYAQNQMAASGADFVYTDLWHDVGDGLDLYLKMKEYEGKLPGAKFMYWIENTMLCYL